MFFDCGADSLGSKVFGEGGAEGAFEEGAEVAFGEAEGGAYLSGGDVFGQVDVDVAVDGADEGEAVGVGGYGEGGGEGDGHEAADRGGEFEVGDCVLRGGGVFEVFYCEHLGAGFAGGGSGECYGEASGAASEFGQHLVDGFAAAVQDGEFEDYAAVFEGLGFVGEFGEVEVAGGDEHEVAFAQCGAIAVYFYGHRAFGDIDEFGGFVVVDQDRDAFR